MTHIETPRLILRPFTVEDAEEMFLLNEDPDVIRYTGDLPYNNVDEVKNFILNYEQYTKYKQGRMAMIHKETSAFLGWCGLKYLEEENETDLGYRLHKKYWNKGYATEAGKACLHYGFNQLGLSLIIAHAMKDNQASINVLKKLGMKHIKEVEMKGEKLVFMQITKEAFNQSSPM
jgi:[ribosomal protein S5]-alanine N-acetyltransferase